MAILVDDIVNRAKKVWRDAGSEFSSYAAEWLSDGLLELRSIRPDEACFDENLNRIEFSEVTLGGSINLNIKFRPCLTDYLIHRGLQENTRLEEAAAYYIAFKRKAKKPDEP